MEAKHILTALILLAMISCASAATYFVSPDGLGNQNGESEANSMSLQQAMDYANSHMGEEINFLLLGGNYGRFWSGASEVRPYNPSGATAAEKLSAERTAWVKWRANDYGNKPVFDGVYIGVDRKAFIELDGFKIIKTDDGHSSDYAVQVLSVSTVNLRNMEITGVWKDPASEGLTAGGVLISRIISHSIPSNILVEGCEITKSNVGIMLLEDAGENIVFRNNTIHDTAGSGIAIRANPGNPVILIEGNKIYGEKPVWGGTDYTHGTGISIRSENLIIRNNIVHNYGSTRGIMTYPEIFDGGVDLESPEPISGNFIGSENVYQEGSSFTGRFYRKPDYNAIRVFRPTEQLSFQAGAGDIVGQQSGARLKNPVLKGYAAFGGYKNILLEKNLVYDSVGVGVELVDIGENIILSKNTFIGYHIYTTALGNKYYTALRTNFGQQATNGAGLTLKDNIVVGAFDNNKFSGSITESGNIIWSLMLDGAWADKISASSSSKILASINKMLGGADANYFENSNFLGGGNFFDLYSYSRLNVVPGKNNIGDPHGQNLDEQYVPNANSDACPGGIITKGHLSGGECSTTASQCVTTEILTETIRQWKLGTITIQALMQKISAWKAGQAC